MNLVFNYFNNNRYERRPAVIEDEIDLGTVDKEEVWKGEKVRILHHQPKDFTQQPRFADEEKEFQVCFCHD